MGSALASDGSVLELVGIGSVRHGWSFWHLLTEATPVALPPPKPCHANPQQSVTRLVELGLLWGAMALTSSLLISKCHGSPESSTDLSFISVGEKPLQLLAVEKWVSGCAQLGNILPAGKLLWCFGDHLTSITTATGRLQISHKLECNHRRFFVSFGLYQNPAPNKNCKLHITSWPSLFADASCRVSN